MTQPTGPQVTATPRTDSQIEKNYEFKLPDGGRVTLIHPDFDRQLKRELTQSNLDKERLTIERDDAKASERAAQKGARVNAHLSRLITEENVKLKAEIATLKQPAAKGDGELLGCPVCGKSATNPIDEYGVGKPRTRCDNQECWLARSGLNPTVSEWNTRATITKTTPLSENEVESLANYLMNSPSIGTKQNIRNWNQTKRSEDE